MLFYSSFQQIDSKTTMIDALRRLVEETEDPNTYDNTLYGIAVAYLIHAGDPLSLTRDEFAYIHHQAGIIGMDEGRLLTMLDLIHAYDGTFHAFLQNNLY